MEFSHVGDHCQMKTCNQYNFLPTKCRMCHKVFCPNHYEYEKHNCSEAYRLENIPIRCPICKYLLVIPPNMSPDVIVDQHIANHCKTHIDPTDMYHKSQNSKSSSKKKNKRTCAKDGCHFNRMVKCSYCKKKYCHLHRYEDQHDCPKYHPESPPTPVDVNGRKLGTSKKINPFLAKALSAVGMSTEHYLMKRKALKKKNTFLGEDNHTPYGQSSIEKQDRIHMYVYFPSRFSDKQPHQPAVKMYFHKNWSMGKILDKICTFGGIPNRNHELVSTDVDNRLHVLSLAALTDGPLQVTTTLGKLEEKEKVKNGWFRAHGLIVEYGHAIPDLYTKFNVI
mmetsp:Transcript_13752/g.20834  ORF Transcript_13752/g.20834 Transcript_13752/m.20834 type:complete len:336 (-) Transcript_13752:274-1281(-)